MVPEGLLYTEQHEWARIEGQSATVGITDYAQQQLGELTFVELPPMDKKVGAKEQIAVVESSKAASDVYAPLAGRVSEVNTELDSKPELINNDCYGAGWICRLRLDPGASTDRLMNAKQYEEYLKGL